MHKTWRDRTLIGASCLLVLIAAATGCSRPNAAPAVASITFVGTPARGDTYELGEIVEVVVEFDREVMPTGTPRVALTIGEETRQATFSGWNVSRSVYSELSFNYTVKAADRDEDGISIPANALILDDGAIIRGPEGVDADLTHAPVAAERSRNVDGSSVSPPAVKEISFVSSPLRDDTYEHGATISVRVVFDRVVTATGDPRVALTIGTETRHASFWIGPPVSSSLDFRYTVQAADRDEDGISIPANALILDSGTITAADGTTDADLSHDAVAADPAHKARGSLLSPPAVVTMIVMSPPARGDTYGLADTVLVSAYFNKAVTITGDAAHIALNIGGRMRYATIWPGGTSLRRRLQPGEPGVFSYTVQKRDRDRNGISIPANALVLNGGTITAADGVTDAELTHAAIPDERGWKVNGSFIRPAAVQGVSFVSSPVRDNEYELGETVELRVDFDGGVQSTGTPRLALTIGTETRHATLYGLSGHSLHSALYFKYAVQAADRDDDGISIPANALALNGGTITAADGVTDADLTHAAVAERGHRMNGSLISPPAVKRIYLFSYLGSGDTYELGETLEVHVEFDRAVTATGSLQAALTIGFETRYAALSARGSQSLWFEYTVQEGDQDEDGISIPANALVLNGGTIKHAADRTIDADLNHGAMAANPRGKVNGRRARP